MFCRGMTGAAVRRRKGRCPAASLPRRKTPAYSTQWERTVPGQGGLNSQKTEKTLEINVVEMLDIIYGRYIKIYALLRRAPCGWRALMK